MGLSTEFEDIYCAMYDILELSVDNMHTFRAFKLYILTKKFLAQFEHLIRNTLWIVLPLGVRGRLKASGKTVVFIVLLSWLLRLFEFDWR